LFVAGGVDTTARFKEGHLATNGTLYVFLHGLSVGRDQGKLIELVLPDVPGHVQRAGGWLTEEDIAPGSVLELEGVSAGSASLNSSPLMIHLTGCSFTAQGRAATLWLKRPREILPLLLAEDPQLVKITNPTSTAHFAGGGTKLTKLASIQVLVYDYQDENRLSLRHHYWEPCSTGGATSLHIISTSEGPEGDDHDADTEAVLAQLIRGYPGLTVNKQLRVPPANWNETSLWNYGSLSNCKASGEFIVTNTGGFAFAQAELEDIPSRTVRIGLLGRMKQQGRAFQGLWHEGQPLVGTCSNCGAMSI
jgi:hypothetical protein